MFFEEEVCVCVGSAVMCGTETSTCLPQLVFPVLQDWEKKSISNETDPWILDPEVTLTSQIS